jgi:hypothetical protein
MIKALSCTLLALLAAFSQGARAATVEDSFDSIVGRAKKFNQTPAQGCDANSCWQAWRIVNRQRAMLAIQRSYNSGGGVDTACWTEPADYMGSMTCMTTRGENFVMSPSSARIWSERVVQANPPAPPASPVVNLDLNCSAPVVAKGDAAPGRNPVVAAHVRLVEGVWSITFRLADGSIVDRADQYNGGGVSAAKLAENNATAKQPAVAEWAGVHKRHGDVVMIGSLYRVDPATYRYVEVVASTRHLDDAKVMVALCGPAASVASSAPPTPAPVTAAPSAPAPSSAPDPSMAFSAARNEDCDNCVTVTAAGTIVAATDKAFLDAVKAQEEQRKRVTVLRLSSPGGSLGSALAMGRFARQKGLKTVAEDICASACAFVFMGGVARHATPMMLGVHQFFLDDGAPSGGAATAIKTSQFTVSELLTYAKEMGVDSEVIGIAEATPPSQMHFFGATELSALNLNTKP